MTKKTFSLHSFSKDYSIITAIIGLVIAGCLVWIMLQIHSDGTMQSERITQNLSVDAKYIDEIVSTDFDYTAYQMQYIAKYIKEHGSSRGALKKFLSTFRAASVPGVAISWNMFSWVEPSGFLTIDGNEGILAEPVNLTKRDYLPYTVSQPEKIFFGKPVYGAVSQNWVMPAGMGVMDDNDRYIGSVVFGFDIGDFINKLEHIINNPALGFAILLNDQIILESNSAILAPAGEIIDALKLHPPTERSGILSTQAILNKGMGFSVFQRLANYPFTIVVSYDKRLSYAEFWSLSLSRVGQFFIIGWFTLLLIYITRKRIVNPMVKLSDAALAISEGNTNVQMPEVNSIEADNLAKALERVKILIKSERHFKHELTTAHARVKLANESLEQKVTERTVALKRALQVKTEFLNNISHEIRTPVHGVMNYAELLVEGWDNMDDQKRRYLATRLHDSSDRLHQLVANLLDVAQFRAGTMAFLMGETDLAMTAKEVFADCQAKHVGDKPITLLMDPALCGTDVVCDGDRIAQVIRHLVRNAIKYSDKGTVRGSIDRVSFNQGEGICFSVADEGKGIPEDELQEIFTPFTQSTRTKTSAGGTGLGLSICKEIITGHGGQIWAKNNPDGGTTFTFVLPIVQ